MKSFYFGHFGLMAAGLLALSFGSPARAQNATGGCCHIDGTCANNVGEAQCLKDGGIPLDQCPSSKKCLEPGECRMTGGGHDTSGFWTGTLAKGEHLDDSGLDQYTFGGQAGAPTASQPQPYGEWTHHQKAGPDGSFNFHMGTASAPDDALVKIVTCSDPENCVPARTAPFKQLDFAGVGVFHNIRKPSPALAGVVAGETRHCASVHVEDLGEPGKGGKVEPAGPECPATGSKGALANCSCPDFYQLTIHGTPDQAPDGTCLGPVIYHVYGYLTGGNIQIHPAIR